MDVVKVINRATDSIRKNRLKNSTKSRKFDKIDAAFAIKKGLVYLRTLSVHHPIVAASCHFENFLPKILGLDIADSTSIFVDILNLIKPKGELKTYVFLIVKKLML